MRNLVAPVLAVVVLWLAAPAAQAQGGCGFTPLMPPPPIGCRALRPICVCDQQGSCHWVFECVPD